MKNPGIDGCSYCVLCGAPIGEYIDSDNERDGDDLPPQKDVTLPEWLHDKYYFSIKVQTEHSMDESISTDDIKDTFITEEDLEVEPWECHIGPGAFVTGAGNGCSHHWFLLHRSCKKIFERSIVARKGPSPHLNRHIHSYLQLYLALEAQFDIEFQADDDPCVLNWPNEYFGAAEFQQIAGYPFPTDWLRIGNAEIYETDPFNVPAKTTTDYILSHLEPMPAADTASHNTAQSIGASFNALTADIRNQILEELSPFENPSLECSRILTSYDWLHALFDEHEPIIPWLWDLDKDGDIIPRVWDRAMIECLEKGEIFVRPEVLEWDWEKLVRQLAQTTVMCLGGLMDDAPLGIRNRRRIWMMLNEMELTGKSSEEGTGSEVDDEGDLTNIPHIIP